MPSSLIRVAAGLGAAIPLMWVPAAAATALTFVAAPGKSCALSTYGDRVTAQVQKGCGYGTAAGSTPNITVTYLPGLQTYQSGYGDLSNVLIAPGGIISITLKADPGFRVVLRSFHLAAWQYKDYRVRSVQVLGERGKPLFSRSNALIRSSGPSHASFKLSGVAARILKIRVDARDQGSNIGIDNIVFSQRRAS